MGMQLRRGVPSGAKTLLTFMYEIFERFMGVLLLLFYS